MKKHTKIYFNFFKIGEEDFVACEVCTSKAVDIHHIEARGLGGSKEKDYIENLVALCRNCHNNAGSSKIFNEKLKHKHLAYIKFFKEWKKN
jgi:5-methylcytosine-specific restriction endonuclease McrA|tara:strand:- start:243 stop:515 length:273 start_codon:yes stop_codon:yes gene_type:complete